MPLVQIDSIYDIPLSTLSVVFRNIDIVNLGICRPATIYDPSYCLLFHSISFTLYQAMSAPQEIHPKVCFHEPYYQGFLVVCT